MCLVDDRCERPRVVRGPAEHGTSCFAAGQLNWCKCCVALRRRRTLARAKDASRVPGTVAGASTNESKYAGTDPTTLSVLVGHRGRSTRRELLQLTIVHDITAIARKIADVESDVSVIGLGNPNRDMLENMFQLSRIAKGADRDVCRLRGRP